MRFDNLEGWLHWLEGLKIVRVREDAFLRAQKIAHQLNLFPDHSTVITVGGTNGKGSTVAVLESIYRAAQYRVGAYTSPHLFSFNERIKINGKPVEDSKMVEAFQAIDDCRKDVPLNYFQFATLAAFLLFKQAHLDVWLLEVGIGGRLDTVNLIEPDASVITQVGWDHCDVLGDTLEQIAMEKAGIMRQGTPVVIGDAKSPSVLFSEAVSLNALLFVQERDFQYEALSDGCSPVSSSPRKRGSRKINFSEKLNCDGSLNAEWNWCSKQSCLDHLPKPNVLLQNASTALMVIELLQHKLSVNRVQVEQGLKQARIIGRCAQIEVQGVHVVLDVAHNPSATPLLLNYLQQHAVSGKKYAVVGMMRDKDIAGTLQVFEGVFDEWFLASLPEPRGAKSEAVQNVLSTCSIESTRCYENPMDAFENALKQASPSDWIVVFGSFYAIAAVMDGLK